MEIKSTTTERILKSFGFSLALFLFWGSLTAWRTRGLVEHFGPIECAWLIYNATSSVLFLIRSRPSIVSMNPVHWIVALVTSFSGFVFKRYGVEPLPIWAVMSDTLIFLGLVLGGAAALALGRSYDFLPALRGVQAKWVYEVIRHPMYLSSIAIRLGYLVRHFSVYNLAVFVVTAWLYDKRAAFEEAIMRNDPRYRDYAQKVRSRFLPGIY